MKNKNRYSFPKAEKLCSRRDIDFLFEPGHSKSLSAFPMRLVYHVCDKTEDGTAQLTQLLISVPKRQFKHAVDRNRVKRQVREAYRTNRELLPDGRALHLAVIWLDSRHYPSAVVEAKLRNLLERCSEAIRKS